MKTFDQLLLPLGILLAAACATFVADRAARLRRRDGDRGDFWTRAVQRICLCLALPLLLSGALETVFPRYWQTGRHLHFDLTGVFGWSLPASYRIALLLPFAVWGGLLLFGLSEKPGDRASARWLAGGIGFHSSRRWVLLCALPFALLVLLTLPRLGGGQSAYPGAAWGTAAVLLLSLAGVAWSAGITAGSPAGAAREAGASVAAGLQPWPQALAAHGIKLRRVTSWPASAPARAPRPASGGGLAERFRLLGAREIAPELLEAIDALVEGGTAADGQGPTRIVLAPDGCGQAEAVALSALLLDQRLHATTLVVTAGDAPGLAAQLRPWLPSAAAVGVFGATGEPPWNALVWVVEAQVLSDRLLPLLNDPLQIKRFGLIVWWRLEAYTGVLAANLWAISRRLHRLLQARGRRDVRTLALVRSAPHGSAQLASFVRRLLPHPFPSSAEVHVGQRFAREVHLHLLESHQAHFARGEGRDLQERHRHLPLVAARVSVEAGWTTCLEVPADVAEPEASAVLQLPAAGSILRDHLRIDAAGAGARLLRIEAGDVLSLPEIVCQGGRTAPDGLPHHVGLTLPANPYVAYLIGRLEGREGAALQSSRRLVAAEALPAVVRRHLLLALHELPDTRSGLLKDFLWNEEVIRRTLDEISQEGKLTRREVRFLADGDRLVIDHEYSSQRLPGGDQRPLDTVGTALVEVRELAGGYDPMGGVRLRVDPERVTVQAYPHRVFLQGGRRYRIREWDSLDEVLQSRTIACDREDVHSQTWRIRNPLVFGLEPLRPPVGVGRTGKLLSRFPARLIYEEEIAGALRVAPLLTAGQVPRPETLRLARPILQSFATRALVLRFPEDAEPLALASLAQALRHVLPVHLGVDEDALEVVPLTGEMVDGLPTSGLAIVDLYPGGIGLVDEIGDDNPFLLQMLEQTREWLQTCSCQSDAGCDRCLRSPAALAANIDQPPLREAALSLLRQVV